MHINNYICMYPYQLCTSRAAMPRVDARAQDGLHRGADLGHGGLQDVLHALAVHVRHLRGSSICIFS